jgi:hypothetical protein
MIGTFQEKDALIIVLRVNILPRIHCGTTNAKIAPRIALNVIIKVLVRNVIHGLILLQTSTIDHFACQRQIHAQRVHI